MEMEEYNKISTIEKPALEIKKPTLRLPAKPVYREPYKPVYQEPNTRNIIMFDPEVLASSYINLHGYERAANADIQISIDLHEFEYFDPERVMKKTTKYNSSTKQTEEHTIYYYETKYRHPASLSIIKNGAVIYNQIFEPSNEYTQYSSTSSPNKSNLEKSSVSNTLLTINKFINSEYGFAPIEVSTLVGYVKNKSGEYDDLEEALALATSGYTASKDNKEAAVSDLTSAVNIWNTAAGQADLEDRKARIDKKVANMLYQNLIVANMYLNNFNACQTNFDALETLKLSYNDKKVVEDLKVQFEDRKKRHAINN